MSRIVERKTASHIFVVKEGEGTQEEMWRGQIISFRLQMKLAQELNRPVSTHCVGAQGLMFDLFRAWSKKKQLPAKVALHSYGGTIEMAKAFLGKSVRSKVYFGFSFAINMRSPKTKDVIKFIPDDRLLPETDLDHTSDMEEYIKEMYEIIASVKAWSLEETVEKLKANSEEFFCIRQQ